MEEAVIEVESDGSDYEDSDCLSEFSDTESIKFQKTRRLEHLPYYLELEKEANNYFIHVKSGLGYSVSMRDVPGLLYWIRELERFISLHSFRFSKVDHVHMLGLFYNVVTMKNLDLKAVKIICQSMSRLLSKESMVLRCDLKFEWRPLYDLYVRVFLKNFEEDAVSDNFKKILETTIVDCTRYFNDSATREILAEVRPYLCQWDEHFVKGIKILCIFLPVCLTKEENDQFGAKLWIEEMLFFLNRTETSDQLNILLLFARLAKDCPGYFDFSPYLDQLFTILMSFFQIEIGVDRIVAITNCSNEFSAFADIFTYSFGMNGDKIQGYISQLFLSLECYFNPSNTGQHTKNLLNFLHKLVLSFLNRVSRERFQEKKFVNQIPENIKIKDDQIKTFVKSILPCIEYAAFDKQRDYCVPAIIRLLAFLSPEIIVPFVLDLVYSSLQALTEPHRLIQALEILSPVCVVISRHELKYEKKSIWTRILNKIMNIFINREEENEVRGSRWIAIDLMGDLLNELDIYNTEKTQLIFRVLANLMMLIPIVDCSQAPLVCRDLSPEEEQLCAKTASFELFVEELMRKIFSMIDFLGNSVTDRHDLASTKNVGKNMEESVIENGVLIIFRSLVRNCSSTFYNRIADQFFNFVNEHFYNSKPAMDTITKMAGMLVGNDPQVQFARFFNFAVRKFDEHYHADSEAEEEVDRALIWYLNFAAELVRSSSGNIIIENRNLIDPFIEKILRFKSPNIYKLVAIFAHNVLTSICSTYPIPNCLRTRYDQPFDKFLPIRHCAEPINKDHWKINWHIPTIEEVDYASELVNKFITTPLEQLLANFKDTTDKEVLKILKIAHHALMACSHLLPFHNVMPINLIPMAVPNVVLDIVTIRRYVKKIIGPSGSNYRLFLFFIIKQIGEKLLNERENDTKSSIEILYLIRTLTHERGANSTNYRKQLKAFKMVKELTSDPMSGSRTIEQIMERKIFLLHMKRLVYKPLVGFTPSHLEALQLAFRYATSTYTAVRQTAQKLLDDSFNSWPYSYKFFVDNLVKILEDKTKTTPQFKGVLHILSKAKETSMIKTEDEETTLSIWPVLSLAESPDPNKQSIVALFDFVQDLIRNNHTSFQIEFKFPNTVFQFADALLEDHEGSVHISLPLVSREEINGSTERETKINAEHKSTYHSIAKNLFTICCDKNLHFCQLYFAHSLLRLLLRRDICHVKVKAYFYRQKE